MADRAMTVAYTTHDARARAADLADEFHLPLENADEILAPGGARLLVGVDAVALEVAGFGRPLRVDFISPRLDYRLRRGGREQLLQACGVPRNAGVSLVDGTGGFGIDAFVLAHAGARVTVLERHPIVFALLRDAHLRAKREPKLAEAAARMQLVHADAIEWLAVEQRADVVYLDPMFPARRKSALVKRPMRMLEAMVDDERAERLLSAAIGSAGRRVVLKRPLRGAVVPLARDASFSLQGRSVRFDVYELP